MRFVGVKDNQIFIVTDSPFESDNIKLIEVPEELSHVSAAELITHCRIKNGKIVSRLSKKHAQNMKIALVGNWKMRCGISTYSENLWSEVVKHVGDYKLFIERNENPTGPINVIGNSLIDESKVVACWKRGESLKELIAELKEYDPDIIWIQHEFGLWSNACYWLSLMSQLANYRVIVTMHSVFHHKDKTIVEAAMPEIVVHSEGGKQVLTQEKQVPGKVYVIPHGCPPYDKLSKLWNFYKSEKTFMQFGFGFRYKGWENAIKAAAILKEKYPDVFFTGLFSESSHNKLEHDFYYNELMDLIQKLDLQENVAIIRGYQSEESIDSYIRTNKVTLFPYVSHPAHEVFGASGAARVAMSKGVPVVTSSVNHFLDLPTIKADSPQEIAEELEKLFLNSAHRHIQIQSQIDYLNSHTWEKIALKYISLFENG